MKVKYFIKPFKGLLLQNGNLIEFGMTPREADKCLVEPPKLTRPESKYGYIIVYYEDIRLEFHKEAGLISIGVFNHPESCKLTLLKQDLLKFIKVKEISEFFKNKGSDIIIIDEDTTRHYPKFGVSVYSGYIGIEGISEIVLHPQNSIQEKDYITT